MKFAASQLWFSVFCMAVSVCTAQDPSPAPAIDRVGVYVAGSVVHQGFFSLPPGASLVDAIDAAGGLNDLATKIVLLRRNAPPHSHGVIVSFTREALGTDTAKNTKLINQDQIVVQKKGKVIM